MAEAFDDAVFELERQRGELEREWAKWGPPGTRLSEARSWRTVLDPATGAITREPVDLLGPMIDRLKGAKIPLPTPELAEILDAGGATLVAVRPPGPLMAGQEIHAQNGDFPGKADDVDILVGPVAVPQPCTIKAHIVGEPEVPRKYTQGDSNTSMTVWYERRLADGYAPMAMVIHLRGLTTDNDLTGTADLPGDGRLRLVYGHPHGRGPLTGENYPQHFESSIVVDKIPLEFPVTAGARLHTGDLIRAGDRPCTVRLANGSTIIIDAHSEATFTSDAAGKLNVSFEKGAFQACGPKSEGLWAKPQFGVLGYSIEALGTDFKVGVSDREAVLEVTDGAVKVSRANTAAITVEAGQRLHLPSGELGGFEIAGSKPPLVYGLPPDLASMDARSPQRYGAIGATFEEDQVSGDWIWEDPDNDAVVRTPEDGTLSVSVPHGNDLAETRHGAPRLLHKVTGDFALSGELLVTTRAEHWVGADWLVKSPGSYLGAQLDQLPIDGAGAHYWMPSTCWSFAEGRFEKLPRLNWGAFYQGIDAPDEPIRVRMTRHDDLWRTYWSADGSTWNLASIRSLDAPETVFVGWCFRRWAWDGRNEPGLFTLRDVELESLPTGMMAPPTWDAFCQHGRVIEGEESIILHLDGSGPGAAQALSGGRLTGDFDVVVRYDTGIWEPKPGETRVWTVVAATGDERWRVSISGARSDAVNPQRLYSTARIDGVWGPRALAASEQGHGRFRLARKDGVVATYYETPEGWMLLGDEPKITEPLHLWLEASNGDKALAYPEFTVSFSIEPFAATEPIEPQPDRPKPPVVEGEPTATVVLCELLDEEGRPHNPAQVFTGFAGPAGLPGQPGLPGTTPSALHAVITMHGIAGGETVQVGWKHGSKLTWQDHTVPANGIVISRWGPLDGGLPAGVHEVDVVHRGTLLARQEFSIVAGEDGPPGPAVAADPAAPVDVTAVQGDNLLKPIALPEGLRLPRDIKAKAFEAPFMLGRPFFGPGGETFLLSCDRKVGMILQVHGVGVATKVCEADVLRGENWRGAIYQEGRFVTCVDYNPAGGTSHQGVIEISRDGSATP